MNARSLFVIPLCGGMGGGGEGERGEEERERREGGGGGIGERSWFAGQKLWLLPTAITFQAKFFNSCGWPQLLPTAVAI